MNEQKPTLEFKMTNPEIGKTYPLYGIITEIISEEPLVIIINYNIEARCILDDIEKINILKERAFEPGIFITEIDDRKEDMIYGTVKTIIFGKKQILTNN